MTSLNLDFIKSISSNDDSAGVSEKDIASVEKFDGIIIQERPAQVVEISHSFLWLRKVFSQLCQKIKIPKIKFKLTFCLDVFIYRLKFDMLNIVCSTSRIILMK